MMESGRSEQQSEMTQESVAELLRQLSDQTSTLSQASLRLNMHSGERVILLTDGVIERHMERGGKFGVDGLKRAIEQADRATAASTAASSN